MRVSATSDPVTGPPLSQFTLLRVFVFQKDPSHSHSGLWSTYDTSCSVKVGSWHTGCHHIRCRWESARSVARCQGRTDAASPGTSWAGWPTAVYCSPLRTRGLWVRRGVADGARARAPAGAGWAIARARPHPPSAPGGNSSHILLYSLSSPR